MTTIDGIECYCGTPVVQFQVRRDSPNFGRYFYKCSQRQCDFFQWTGTRRSLTG